ncbi:MAG: hypothetical protein WC867_07435 [Candidatus Pacearchaeota archaeon]|jgi:hypothetical protein
MHRPEDHTQQLADYFKKNLAKGYTLDSLRFSLINQGYSRISINKAVEIANLQLADSAPVIREKPQITYTAYSENEKIDLEKGFFKKIIKKLFKK